MRRPRPAPCAIHALVSHDASLGADHVCPRACMHACAPHARAVTRKRTGSRQRQPLPAQAVQNALVSLPPTRGRTHRSRAPPCSQPAPLAVKQATAGSTFGEIAIFAAKPGERCSRQCTWTTRSSLRRSLPGRSGWASTNGARPYSAAAWAWTSWPWTRLP